MNSKQEERFVVAFERIASSLEQLSGTGQRLYDKQYPEAKRPRDATFSRIPTAEEKLKAEQGNTNDPLGDWLSLNEEEEIGPRERAFLEVQASGRSKSDAGAQATPKDSGSRSASPKAARSRRTNTPKRS